MGGVLRQIDILVVLGFNGPVVDLSAHGWQSSKNTCILRENQRGTEHIYK